MSSSDEYTDSDEANTSSDEAPPSEDERDLLKGVNLNDILDEDDKVKTMREMWDEAKAVKLSGNQSVEKQQATP